MDTSVSETTQPQKINYGRWYVIGVILVALASGGFIFQTQFNQPSYEMTAVEVQTITQKLEVSGNVKPNGRIDVYSSTNGVIQELYVENGQYVEKDQPLFAVVSTATPQEKAAAKAAVTSAYQAQQAANQEKLLVQSQLESARQAILDAQASVTDLENNPNASTQYDEAERESIYSELTAARQAFANAEKKYQEFDTKIAATSQNTVAKQEAFEATTDQIVTAVLPGSISNIAYDEGDEVFISADSRSAAVLSLTDFNQYTVEVDVKESDIYKVKTGQKVEVILEALADTIFSAVVEKIDSLGEIEQGVVNYSVTISLDETDERIRPGMTANASILLDTTEAALVVPNSYISKDNSSYTILVQNGDQVETREISIGVKDTQVTQVLSGLSQGDVVLKQVE